MASGADVVRVAKTQLGLTGATRYGGNPGDAWCALFVRWCAMEAGVPARIVPKKPWCSDLRDFYRDMGRYYTEKTYTPKVGDIICFNWLGEENPQRIQHVGLVTGADATYVYTIEGNAGISRNVCTGKYRRTSGVIAGYCAPLYEEKEKKEDTTVRETKLTVVEEKPVITKKTATGAARVTPKSGQLTIAMSAGGITFTPRVLAGASLSYARHAPGTLSFEVLPGGESFFEGSRVYAYVGEELLFSGYVFTKSRDKDGIIRVTAYDSLRYFKNKDFYIYENKRASELFSILCRDHALPFGSAEESSILLPYRVEDHRTLFDIMDHAIEETEQNGGGRFCYFDACGRLQFRRAWDSGAVLDASNVTNFAYSSSLDGRYNRVKAVSEDRGVRNIVLVQDSDAIGRYGLLQTTLKGDADTARGVLRKHNKIHRRLRITACGNLRVQYGSLVTVRLDVGDLILNELLTVERVSHTWDGHGHTMELTLEGGEFDA